MDGPSTQRRQGRGPTSPTLNLATAPDGVQPLRLEVEGDGTAGAGLQDATLRVDRTPPVAAVALVGLPGGSVRATVSVSDATSGVRDWRLRARGPDGPTVASSATGGDIVEIDLAQHAAPGESIRFVLTATDNAGLSREVSSALATRPSASGGAPATTVIGGDGPLGEPGRIEGSGASLPNFSRIETRGIRAHQARSYSRTGRLLIPLIASTYSRPVSISGRFLHTSGRGLRGATVYLVDPKGFTAATTLTDRRGRFTFHGAAAPERHLARDRVGAAAGRRSGSRPASPAGPNDGPARGRYARATRSG